MPNMRFRLLYREDPVVLVSVKSYDRDHPVLLGSGLTFPGGTN